MKQRINLKQLEPKVYEVLYSMEEYLSTTDLSVQLRELIKVRVSQINKCAFCIELHSKDAIKAGETQRRLLALTAWEESPLFSDEEKAVLAFTEAITLISHAGVSDAVFAEVKRYYNDNQICQIIAAINQMNFWNRIALSTKMSLPV